MSSKTKAVVIWLFLSTSCATNSLSLKLNFDNPKGLQNIALQRFTNRIAMSPSCGQDDDGSTDEGPRSTTKDHLYYEKRKSADYPSFVSRRNVLSTALSWVTATYMTKASGALPSSSNTIESECLNIGVDRCTEDFGNVATNAPSDTINPTTTTKAPTRAILEWVGEGTPFCSPSIQFDLAKIKATPETISAIYGSRDPEEVRIFTSGSGKQQLQLQRNDAEGNDENQPYWPLQPNERYGVALVSSLLESNENINEQPQDNNDITLKPSCSINQIFFLLGNDAEEIIRRLTLTFYKKVWLDESEANESFRKQITRSVSTPEEAADNQATFLIETWGGPKLYTNKFGLNKDADDINKTRLSKRVLSKHSSKKRMSFNNAKIWLFHMNEAMAIELKEFPQEVKSTISLYWAHFFALFPFDENERKVIRHMTSLQYE